MKYLITIHSKCRGAFSINLDSPRSLMARDLRVTSLSERMATKVKLMKLLQEIRGYAQISQRRQQPKPPGLFLLQLRSHLNQPARRRRLSVPIQMHENPDIPNPVKITIIESEPALLPHFPAQ